MGVRLAGILAVVPADRRGIEDLHKRISEPEARRIVNTTGVRERRVAEDRATTADLGEAASKALLTNLGMRSDELDGIILVTQTPDYLLPATACILQHRLGAPKSAFAFDVNIGCSGYPYGLAVAHAFVASGSARRVLLVVGDVLTKRVHPDDPSTSPLFGDAATATVLVEDSSRDDFLAFDLGTDGSGWNHLVIPVGQCRYRNEQEYELHAAEEVKSIPFPHHLYMDGGQIFAFTLREVPGLVQRTLAKAGVSLSEVDYLFIHQANRFIIEHLCNKIAVPVEKAPQSIDRYGNTSGGSPALTACDVVPKHRPPGDLLSLFLGFGVGFSWGGALVRLASHCVFPIQEV